MKIRKDLIVVALATFCLTATLFMVVLTRSADDPNWDPWVDIKEDGTVDIYDAITLANAYGTSGDTTKNVTVTNWPPRFLNVTLADNLVIEGSYEFEADVAGYSRVTLVVWKGYEPFQIDMYINFQIGSVYTPNVYANNNFTAGYQFVLRDFEVLGPKILITGNTFDPVTISLGLYATD